VEGGGAKREGGGKGRIGLSDSVAATEPYFVD